MATKNYCALFLALAALAVTGCGDGLQEPTTADAASSFDGAAASGEVVSGCPPGFAGCQAGERWVCNDQGSGFQKQPCASGTFCSEGLCVACAAEHPCADGRTCVNGLCQVAPLAITTKTLPDALVGQAYTAQLAGQGGVPPYSWKLSQGALPAGILLNESGAFSGAATAGGTFSFQVELRDSASKTAQQILVLDVKAGGLVISTTSPLPTATEGEAYTTQLAAQGGTPPYYWGIAGGKLPKGLSLGSDGSIGGTPSEDGDFTFTVKVFDNGTPPLTAQKELVLPIKLAPLQIVGAQELNLFITKIIVLPLIIVVDKVPVPYNAKLEAKGGKKPYTWSETPLPSVVKNFLPTSGIPTGLTLAKDGTISGGVSDASLVFELKVPLSPLVLKGFFFAAQVSDSQSKPDTKQALFIIPTVPIGN
ncbi:MAG: putative Ig domain-containing protein [Deltaproteobacteria bacterium]|nr:putative Ig domain-containing protein [Deltaproteobacteria bacterium]